MNKPVRIETTPLLEQQKREEQEALANRHNGVVEVFQKRNHVWAVAKLKPQLTELEYAAGCRAVLECSAAFDGMRSALGERVDNSGSDYGLAARVSAIRRLENLRQAARARVGRPNASNCVEWLCQLWSLSEIAAGLGQYTMTGPALDRRRTPNSRAAAPFVRLVLCAMSNYYDEIDRDLQSNNKSATLC